MKSVCHSSIARNWTKLTPQVLNGYGFCIPNNHCDEVAIRFGQLPPPITSTLEEILGEWNPAQSHYIRGHDHFLGLYPISLPDHPEAKTSGIPPTIWTVMEVLKKFQDSQQGQRAQWRSTLSARCDLLEILATKYDNIDQYCDFLPESPRNLKQQYAKIYRENQMRILKENHGDVKKLVEKANFISLDYAVQVLKGEQAEVDGKSWELALEIIFKTDDLASIREQGVEREVWILWLCAAWLSICEFPPLCHPCSLADPRARTSWQLWWQVDSHFHMDQRSTGIPSLRRDFLGLPPSSRYSAVACSCRRDMARC